MSTLRGRCTKKNIPLNLALSQCVSALCHKSPGVALIYSPTRCQFAKINQIDGSLTDSNHQTINLESVFELRAFNQDCELRWLNDFDGFGRAVLISGENLDISSYLDQDVPEISALYTIPQTYLLWGKGSGTTANSGWGKLSAARIGFIDVPLAGITKDKRVYLKSMEYLSQVDQHGNISVVEERLYKLEVK